MRTARQAYMGLAYLYTLGILVQVFLAGIGIFGSDMHEDIEPHEEFGGWVLTVVLPALLLIAALIGRMGWRFAGLAGLLFVLAGLETYWVQDDNSRFIRAIHPAMAIVLFAYAHFLGQSARRLLRGEPVMGAAPA